jgi:glycosidase
METRMRFLALAALSLALCASPAQGAVNPAAEHVGWSRHATIYEVNLRQYTKEGTIRAFLPHLPRLKKMGVDIVWIMPIHPVGARNRKGSLGSYYAVRDYTAVNPEFGTLEDMKALVQQAHALGMKVIIDWVANHTAWDNPWATQHKDWYKLNDKGELFPVTYNDGAEPEYWTDVTALNYENKALWKGMTDAMAYWVRETDIDGFRCDVAKLVPQAFWNQARAELDKIKPVFMLAEAEAPQLHEAFDMTYSWRLMDILKDIAKGKAAPAALKAALASEAASYPPSAYRMLFTNNHDWNSWQGSDPELYGPAYQVMAVLTATLPGMPLVYSGQEAGLSKRLEFFEKDPIDWKNYPLAPFYTRLLKLKKDNPALGNGQYGAPLDILDAANDKVFAFRRAQGANVVTVVANLSAAPQQYRLAGSGKGARLGPWSWRVKTTH